MNGIETSCNKCNKLFVFKPTKKRKKKLCKECRDKKAAKNKAKKLKKNPINKRLSEFWFKKYKKRDIKRLNREQHKKELLEQRKLEAIRHTSLWIPLRDAAIERDKGCIKCGSVEKMNAHHIHNFKDFPELRYKLSNIVILCEQCHVEFHRQCGKSKNDIKQIQNFVHHKIEV